MVFESQFQICTNLAGIANALARNYRQDGGAETSKRLRTPRSIHAIHPILMIKGLVEGGSRDCGGNPENTTVIARGLVDEVLGSVGGWRERLQGLFVP
ncbi:unnamed protein product [Fusarium graminearum]|nr:unnamed protein product [Fusarium graminearum]CAG1974333.1 unnamed protein product [Fusarium graminearum]VTO88995.1 unnamed protein product [Fusarium graminearum]